MFNCQVSDKSLGVEWLVPSKPVNPMITKLTHYVLTASGSIPFVLDVIVCDGIVCFGGFTPKLWLD